MYTQIQDKVFFFSQHVGGGTPRLGFRHQPGADSSSAMVSALGSGQSLEPSPACPNLGWLIWQGRGLTAGGAQGRPWGIDGVREQEIPLCVV